MSDKQLFLHGLITFFFHHSSCNKLWYKSYISKLSKRQIKGQTSMSHIMADICLAESYIWVVVVAIQWFLTLAWNSS